MKECETDVFTLQARRYMDLAEHLGPSAGHVEFLRRSPPGVAELRGKKMTLSV